MAYKFSIYARLFIGSKPPKLKHVEIIYDSRFWVDVVLLERFKISEKHPQSQNLDSRVLLGRTFMVFSRLHTNVHRMTVYFCFSFPSSAWKLGDVLLQIFHTSLLYNNIYFSRPSMARKVCALIIFFTYNSDNLTSKNRYQYMLYE